MRRDLRKGNRKVFSSKLLIGGGAFLFIVQTQLGDKRAKAQERKILKLLLRIRREEGKVGRWEI